MGPQIVSWVMGTGVPPHLPAPPSALSPLHGRWPVRMAPRRGSCQGSRPCVVPTHIWADLGLHGIKSRHQKGRWAVSLRGPERGGGGSTALAIPRHQTCQRNSRCRCPPGPAPRGQQPPFPTWDGRAAAAVTENTWRGVCSSEPT